MRMVAVKHLPSTAMMATARGGASAPGRNVRQKRAFNRKMAESATGETRSILAREAGKSGSREAEKPRSREAENPRSLVYSWSKSTREKVSVLAQNAGMLVRNRARTKRGSSASPAAAAAMPLPTPLRCWLSGSTSSRWTRTAALGLPSEGGGTVLLVVSVSAPVSGSKR